MLLEGGQGTAKAIGLVYPQLKGKLDGAAMRVPVPDASVVDLTFNASRETTVDELATAFRTAADGELKGILKYAYKDILPTGILHRRKKGFGIPRYYLKDLDGGKPTQEHLLQSLFL